MKSRQSIVNQNRIVFFKAKHTFWMYNFLAIRDHPHILRNSLLPLHIKFKRSRTSSVFYKMVLFQSTCTAGNYFCSLYFEFQRVVISVCGPSALILKPRGLEISSILSLHKHVSSILSHSQIGWREFHSTRNMHA